MAYGAPRRVKITEALALLLRKGGSLSNDRPKIILDPISDALEQDAIPGPTPEHRIERQQVACKQVVWLALTEPWRLVPRIVGPTTIWITAHERSDPRKKVSCAEV